MNGIKGGVTMEWFFVDIINNTKVPRVVKYAIITVVVGFLEFIFIGIAIHGVSVFAMIFGIAMAVLFLVCYLYLIVKIKKYNYVRKDEFENG